MLVAMRAQLHTPAKPPTIRSLLGRVGLLLGIMMTSVFILFFERGLVDAQTGEAPDFLDTIYFVMVTITTVGYGDIVPVSTMARMTDTFFLTPMRFIVFVLFVGIAYELSFKRLQESVRMNRVVQNLRNHIIVCGYGETGYVAVEELLATGFPKDQIVVLESSEAALDEAAKLEVITMLGDASKERVLRSVALDRAAHVVICPGRDDTAVLIALTAHDINPSANLVAICRERENVRLIERSGAHTIVTPEAGFLVAAATRNPHLVETMQDLLHVGGGALLDERKATPDEVGKHPKELSGIAVIRVYRADKLFNVNELPILEEGDILVFAGGANGGT